MSCIKDCCFRLAGYKRRRTMPAHKRSRKRRSLSLDSMLNRDPGLSPTTRPYSPKSQVHRADRILRTINSEFASLDTMLKHDEIANLARLNDALAQKVANLKFDKNRWMAKVKQLEDKVCSNLVKIDEWLIGSAALNKVSIEGRINESEDENAASTADGTALSHTPNEKNADQRMNDLKAEKDTSTDDEFLWDTEVISDFERSKTDTIDQRIGCKYSSLMEVVSFYGELKMESTQQGSSDAKCELSIEAEGEILLDEGKLSIETASKQTLQETRLRAEELQMALDDTKAKADALDCELQRLRSEREILMENNEILQAHKREQEAKLIALEAHKDEQEAELRGLKENKDALEEGLENMNESYALAMEESSQMRQLVEALQDEELKLKEVNDMLETTLAEVSDRCTELEVDQMRLRMNLRDLEHDLLTALQELSSLKAEHENTLLALQKERDTKEALVQDLEWLQSQNTELQLELASARNTISKTEEDAAQHQLHASNLEGEVGRMLEERHDLEAKIIACEVHANKMTANSVEVSKKADEELKNLKETIECLEMALAKANETAKCSEKNVSTLLGELGSLKCLLEKKSKVARVALPTAAVSTGALAAVGFFTFFQFHKRRLKG